MTKFAKFCWTKQITVDDQISYVNKVHEAIHAFLLDLCECEYKYYISEAMWGFEITNRLTTTNGLVDRKYKAYLFMGEDGSSAFIMRPPDILNAIFKKDFPAIDNCRIDLEIADPDFFDKILDFLKSNGVVADEVHPKTET